MSKGTAVAKKVSDKAKEKPVPMSRADRIKQILGDVNQLTYAGCREGDFEATTGGKGRLAHVLVRKNGEEILVGATVLGKYTSFKPVKPGVDPNAPEPESEE